MKENYLAVKHAEAEKAMKLAVARFCETMPSADNADLDTAQIYHCYFANVRHDYECLTASKSSYDAATLRNEYSRILKAKNEEFKQIQYTSGSEPPNKAKNCLKNFLGEVIGVLRMLVEACTEVYTQELRDSAEKTRLALMNKVKHG